MGKTWNMSDGYVCERGHKWVYVQTRVNDERLLIEFRCENGCPTTHIRGVEFPADDGSVCFVPHAGKENGSE